MTIPKFKKPTLAETAVFTLAICLGAFNIYAFYIDDVNNDPPVLGEMHWSDWNPIFVCDSFESLGTYNAYVFNGMKSLEDAPNKRYRAYTMHPDLRSHVRSRYKQFRDKPFTSQFRLGFNPGIAIWILDTQLVGEDQWIQLGDVGGFVFNLRDTE